MQLKWQYLKMTVPGVGTVMGPIEEALREKFFPALFRGEEIDANFRKNLGHSVKHGILGITDPGCQQRVHKTPLRRIVGNWFYSLLGGSALNYVGHRACVRR